MGDPYDRADRIELIAGCEGDVLAELANDVLAGDPPLDVRQEPKPRLVVQRVREPVAGRPFTLGEVVVTPAEVVVDGARGFAMVSGKAERAALSGAIVDAAVAGGHERSDVIVAELEAAAERTAADRERAWAESRQTTVEFESMEGEL
jgi:alpha-D-ribose 1-methylphosphonate 5-triphosphate synthase subunit PhnG